MSKKQLGAAPPDEESNPEAGKKLGWFGRLRAQPGFRTASIAFVLTVVLGIGSTAAYAYWSQKTDMAITGNTAPPVVPVPTVPKCSEQWWPTPTRVSWDPVAGADAEARFIVTFQSPLLTEQVSYAIPPDTFRIEPYNMDLRGLGYSLRERDLYVSLRTAIVRAPSNKIAVIKESDLIHFSDFSPQMAMSYQNLGVASFGCRN